LLAQYQVKTNWFALFHAIVLGFASNGGPVPLPGDVIYTVDIDRPLGAAGVGYTEKDFGSVMQGLGSLNPGDPWPVHFLHTSGEVLSIKGQTVANVPTGAGAFLVCALLGYTWPVEGWE
jgi:hypothetical protein